MNHFCDDPRCPECNGKLTTLEDGYGCGTCGEWWDEGEAVCGGGCDGTEIEEELEGEMS